MSFEVVTSPELAVRSQTAISAFIRDTGNTRPRSIPASLKPQVLEPVAHYILKRKLKNVTDAMLLEKIEIKVGGMVDDRVRDVSRVFTELKMDLKEVDVKTRIAKYFVSFDRLVEDSDLTGMLGRRPATGETCRQRMQMISCDEIRKVDVNMMVDLTHRQAKVDDLVLHA
ncbi:hypothetical protein PHMEG_00010701 [Phytophthora megakarya]|uniref:Uncharacterized protein n=1 Tax=Phytophthora megakarya TaxID=4795 RepID=A0A225WDD2_9STRA|nr:hypothetical protein PHMEG_00010701 [Phytophthora megakarya]